MKAETRTALLHSALLLLTLAGVFSTAQCFLLTAPARSVTERFEEKAEEHLALLASAGELTDLSARESTLEPFGKALTEIRSALDFGRALTVISLVAVHVVNIYLIISRPVGLVLMSLLFIFQLILVFRESNRLRNFSMATGLAAYVFVIAIPLAVMASGQASRLWSSGLRYSCSRKLERFENRFTELEEEAGLSEADRGYHERLLGLQKGLDTVIVGASGSLLADVALLPVFLTLLFYRLGILIANSVFGSLRLEKFGRLLNRVLKGEE